MSRFPFARCLTRGAPGARPFHTAPPIEDPAPGQPPNQPPIEHPPGPPVEPPELA